MATDYLSAILHWRSHAASVEDTPTPTLTTMLYACHRWQETNAGEVGSTDGARIATVRAEIEECLTKRGFTYTG